MSRSKDVTVDKRLAFEAFELPDPRSVPEFYRTHGPFWNRKLFLVWGFTPKEKPYAVLEDGQSLPPIGDIKTKYSIWRWLRWLLLFLLLLLLLMLLLCRFTDNILPNNLKTNITVIDKIVKVCCGKDDRLKVVKRIYTDAPCKLSDVQDGGYGEYNVCDFDKPVSGIEDGQIYKIKWKMAGIPDRLIVYFVDGQKEKTRFDSTMTSGAGAIELPPFEGDIFRVQIITANERTMWSYVVEPID